MKFIDKTKNQQQVHRLLDEFLDSRWNSDSHSYTHIDFENFKFKDYKKAIKTILIAEQSNLCCYCMRELKNDSTCTVEHIVPKNDSSITPYAHYPLINDNVVLQSEFDTATTKMHTPPYPHQLAYENLTASCNGQIDVHTYTHTPRCCNNKRLSELIEPLFYIHDIEDQIKYNKTGLLFFLDDRFELTIDNLQLNYPTLEQIRKVWYCLKGTSFSDIEASNTESDREVLLNIAFLEIADIDQREAMIAKFKTDKFWDVLFQYRWFYGYYQKR